VDERRSDRPHLNRDGGHGFSTGAPAVSELLDPDALARALAIRDHLAPLIRERGEPWPIEPSVVIWETGSFYMAVVTTGDRHALEVMEDRRLLRINWADDGDVEVVAFERGPWEAAALALSNRSE
jgi:hypothetical protein